MAMQMINEEIVVLDAGFNAGPAVTCCTGAFNFIF
jgi:hypothetical protein